MFTRFILFLFISSFLQIRSIAQSFYYCDENGNVGILDLSLNSCNSTIIFSNSNIVLTDIAFHPNGRMFGCYRNTLYEITNGNYIALGEFGTNINSLTCDNNEVI